jgi:regulator-associated protein of mTOR
MCSFILASISRDFPHGQAACWKERVLDNCYERLDDPDFLLRQWTALFIAQMWDCNDEIKVDGVNRGAQDKLIGMLADDSTEVRAAALYALGTFMGASGSADPNKQGGGGTGTMCQLEERVHFRMEVAVATGATIAIKDDASPMCRKELLTVISCLVKEWRGHFVVCAWIYWEEDRKWRSGTTGTHLPLSSSHLHDDNTTQAVAEWLESFSEENRVLLSSFFTIFVVLLDLSVDPYQEVATNAQTIVDYITALLLESPFSRLNSSSLGCPHSHPMPENNLERSLSISDSELETMINSLSIGGALKRNTASFANSLKIFAGNIAFPASEDGHSPLTLHSAQLRSERQDLSRPPSPNMNIAQYASPYYAHPQSGSTPERERTNTSSPRHSQESSSNKDYRACDAMDALMEEDMDRLRARRTAAHHNAVRGSFSSPSNSKFLLDSSSSTVILGLGTGAGIRDVLPLKSSFFNWCMEYFKDPQMRVRLIQPNVFLFFWMFVLKLQFISKQKLMNPVAFSTIIKYGDNNATIILSKIL